MPGSAVPWADAPSARWPAESQTNYLWAAGLWIGAIKNGEPHVTTATYQSELRPGSSLLDHVYVTHVGAPGGARPPSPDADDHHDGRTDEDPLDGRDNDNDGRIDEDFAAISDQMFYCEYDDMDPTIPMVSPQHVPLETVVQQSSLAWAAPSLERDFIG